MSDAAQDIRAAVRAKLASGELPRAKPDKVWAGKGTDRPCAVCGAVITTADIEYEVDLPGASPGTLRFHHDCLISWDQERALQQQTKNKGGPDTGTAA